MFTVQRLQLPPSLYKCLGTAKVIESSQSGVQKNSQRYSLARCRHGRALGRIGLATHSKAFPQGHRPSRSLALAVVLGRENKSSATSEKLGNMILSCLIFNYAGDTLNPSQRSYNILSKR
jgi:hypothetical protein